MATSFIGSPISLTSVADIRYRGILTKIDHEEATIGLSSVYSMGTENRRPSEEFIPPQERPYDYIVFRASEVQNLALDPDPRPEPRSILNDPAVIGTQASFTQPAQQPPVQNVPQQQVPRPYNQAHQTPAPGPASVSSPPAPPNAASRATAAQPGASTSRPRDALPNNSGPNRPRPKTERSETPPVRSASASMETVERAIGDLRISNGSGTNGVGRSNPHRRGRGRGGPHYGVPNGPRGAHPTTVPEEDFDFDQANSRFDKASIYPTSQPNAAPSEVSVNGAASPDVGQTAEEKKESKFYDRSRSFFDDISSDSKAKTEDDNGRGGRGGYGRGRGRTRREDERSKNLNTFGETGMPNGGGAYWPSSGGGRGRRRRPWNGNGQPRQPQQQ